MKRARFTSGRCGVVPEAFQQLSTCHVDLLLGDLGMPGQNGYDLIRELRALEREQGRGVTPAIALTAYAGPEDRVRAFDAGFQMHVTKPISPSDLVDVLAAAMARRDH